METFFVTKVSIKNFKLFLSTALILDEWQVEEPRNKMQGTSRMTWRHASLFLWVNNNIAQAFVMINFDKPNYH